MSEISIGRTKVKQAIVNFLGQTKITQNSKMAELCPARVENVVSRLNNIIPERSSSVGRRELFFFKSDIPT
jgi:hypothetical protein